MAVFTHDGVHPTVPEGHRIYSDTIIQCLNEIRVYSGKVEHSLPQELLVPGNPWEYATMQHLAEIADFSAGWTYVTSENSELAREYQWLFPGLWRAVNPGEAVTVQFVGTQIGLFYWGARFRQAQCDGGWWRTFPHRPIYAA
ncbi:hypothetical protein [Paenibacillus phytorum]|uniref:hypothetical protein n=1 Tax=Paenibacillus phytorum TaxID=2654977 RepID=UPI001FE77817|nr:hypothetical protein [Paenibacillus phytorum]